MADEKDRYRLNLEPRLTEALDSVLRRRGISRTEGVKRLFDWFLEQPQAIQQAILGAESCADRLCRDCFDWVATVVY